MKTPLLSYFLFHFYCNARRYFALLLLVLYSNCICATANDSILITQLLQKLDELQIKENGIFPKGSFPSYRMYALNKTRYKADVNPFFTGLVSFTLQGLMPYLSSSQQQKASLIIDRAKAIYPKFKNRNYPERNTYNFWPTDTAQIFPNGGWLNLFNQQQALADDFDDTVILLMAQNASDADARKVHEFMQMFRNGYKKKINNTLEAYQNIGAYSTWFGEKMPVDFDISVLSNVLYFVQWYHLPWTQADSASLTLMTKIIQDKSYIKSANLVSPHYVKPSVILYHISRLMALKPIPALETFKPSLIAETEKLLSSTGSFMDQVLLSTALLRWGKNPPAITALKANSINELVEDDSFCFFIANIASMLPNPYKKTISDLGIGRFYYHSPGYNYLLLLENLVWQQRGLSK